VTVLLAFPVAYFVSFHVAPSGKALWLFLITIPFWTSYLIRVFLWKVILGYNGVINSGLMGLGIIDEPLTFILTTSTRWSSRWPMPMRPLRSCRSSCAGKDRPQPAGGGQDLGENKRS
jgi:ABC-type sugar transport system permease subunit